MANIGRAYGRIMLTVAALLRGVFSPEQGKKGNKEKGKKKGEKKRTNDRERYGEHWRVTADVQDVRVVGSVYAFLINVTAQKPGVKLMSPPNTSHDSNRLN